MTIPGGGGVAGASVTGHLVGGVHAMGGMHSMAGGHGTVIGHPSGFPGPLTWTPWGVPLAPAGGRRSDEGATGLTAVANPWAALSSGGGWGGGWSREVHSYVSKYVALFLYVITPSLYTPPFINRHPPRSKHPPSRV